MNSKKEFVDAIRKEYDHSESRIRRIAQNLLKKIPDELNSSDIHFVLELIQNADDNEYEKDVTPVLKFNISNEKILIQNNEKGFTEKDVDSLCLAGESTKLAGESTNSKSKQYIGEKGIGFKSVFRISDEPKIFSNGFNFNFKRYDENLKLGYVVPYWIEAIPDYIDLNLTNIVLPLSENVKTELSDIDKIEQSVLLFLHKLKRIEFHYEDETKKQKIWTRTDTDDNIEITHPNGKEHWKIVHDTIRVPDTINEEKRKGVEATKIIFAFPIYENGLPKVTQVQKYFAFLPVKESGFKFAIQADFLTILNRQDIGNDNDWNKWLISNFSDLFLKAIDVFKEDPILKFSYYKYLPLKKDNFDIFKPFVDDLYQKLRTFDCVLTESGTWVTPDKAIDAVPEIRELFSNKDVIKKINKEFLHPNIKNTSGWRSDLDIEYFSFSKLELFFSDNEWLNQKSDEWFKKLYLYLQSKGLTDSQIQQLHNLPIIRLDNDNLISVKSKVIFFPLSSEWTYGFESNWGVIKKTLIDDETDVNKERIKDFLKKLGVKEPNPIEIIENHILNEFEKENDTSIKEKGIASKFIAYLSFIKQNFDACPIGKIEQLQKAVWIKTDNYDGDSFKRPSELYLSSKYGNKCNLESLFETGSGAFVSDCYLGSLESDDELAEKNIDNNQKKLTLIENWKKFFIRLGVNESVKVEREDFALNLGNESEREVFDHLNSVCSNQLIVDERRVTKRVHRFSDWVFSDPKIREIIKSENLTKISLLLKIFDKFWDEKYIKCNLMHHEYKEYLQKSYRTQTIPSSFIRQLKQIKVPTTHNQLSPPATVFLDKSDISAVLGDSVPYLAIDLVNDDFIKTLGLNTTADISSVLNYLKEISEKAREDYSGIEMSSLKRIYDFLDVKFNEKPSLIKEYFTEHKLIYIPESSEKFYSHHEVFWSDVPEILKEYRTSIKKYYPNLESFFVKKLEIADKLLPIQIADLLEDIAKKQEIDENDFKNVRSLYAELNIYLKQQQSDQSDTDPWPWWSDFIQKKIFLANTGKFYNHDEGLLLNDNLEISEKFKNQEGVAFFIIKGKESRFKHFLNAIKIPKLSESYQTTLEKTNGESPNENFDQAFDDKKHFVLQYIYAAHNEAFEKLKESEKIQHLITLRSYSVTTLKICYTLYNNRIKSPDIDYPTFFTGEKLLITGNWTDSTEEIAEEFKKYLDLDEKFEKEIDFILSSPPKKIEKRFKKDGIDQLPEEELAWIKSVCPIKHSRDSLAPEGQIIPPDETLQDITPAKEPSSLNREPEEDSVENSSGVPKGFPYEKPEEPEPKPESQPPDSDGDSGSDSAAKDSLDPLPDQLDIIKKDHDPTPPGKSIAISIKKKTRAGPGQISRGHQIVNGKFCEEKALEFEQKDTSPRFPLLVSHITGYEAPGCDVVSFISLDDRDRFLQDPDSNAALIARFIEVKSRSDKKARIDLKGNELSAAIKYKEKYFLYRFFEETPGHLILSILQDPYNQKEAINQIYEVNLEQACNTQVFELVGGLLNKHQDTKPPLSSDEETHPTP